MKNTTNQADEINSHYRTPQSELAVNDQTNTPNGKLYDPIGIGIVAFLFSAAAGGILLAINFKRLGKLQCAMYCILGGILCVLTEIALGTLRQGHFPVFSLLITRFLGIIYIAQVSQADSIQAHINAGGALESNWKIVGLLALLACLCAVILFIFGVYSLIYGQAFQRF